MGGVGVSFCRLPRLRACLERQCQTARAWSAACGPWVDRTSVSATPSGVWREGGVHPSHHSDVELLFEVDARRFSRSNMLGWRNAPAVIRRLPDDQWPSPLSLLNPPSSNYPGVIYSASGHAYGLRCSSTPSSLHAFWQLLLLQLTLTPICFSTAAFLWPRVQNR